MSDVTWLSSPHDNLARLSKDVTWIHIEGQETMERLRTEFTAFVNQIVKLMATKQKSEEEGIMMGRM